jgi:hypothetical protein
MGKQTSLDFMATSSNVVVCQACRLPIDLIQQSTKEIKSCPNCDDRTWLLNLKSKEACILYGISLSELGGRVRDGN